jgi:hypothetical protein
MNLNTLLLLAACMAFTAFFPTANAADVYKWTDANGQVHFGDHLSAPANGQKIDIKSSPAPAQPAASTQPPAGRPSLEPQSKSTPAEASQVHPGCKELISQIAKVQAGANWQSLYQKFDSSCPGIAYACNNYRAHPEKNKCEWVKRTGSNVLQTNSYP